MNVLEGLITIIQQKKLMLSKLKGGDSGGDSDVDKITVRIYTEDPINSDNSCRLGKIYIDDKLEWYGYIDKNVYIGEESYNFNDCYINKDTFDKLYDAVKNYKFNCYINNYDVLKYNKGGIVIDPNDENNILFGQDIFPYVAGIIKSNDNNNINNNSKYKFLYKYISINNVIVTYVNELGDSIKLPINIITPMEYNTEVLIHIDDYNNILNTISVDILNNNLDVNVNNILYPIDNLNFGSSNRNNFRVTINGYPGYPNPQISYLIF